MKKIYKFLGAAALALSGLLSMGTASAQIPVTDGAAIGQSAMNQIETIAKWVQQYEQMKEQYDKLQQQYQQLQTTYKSINGIRGMADIVNDPAARRYLPDEWQATMDAMQGGGGSLSGSYQQMMAALKANNSAALGLGGTSGSAYDSQQKQSAMNRAIGEEGYRQASKRFDTLQKLLEKIRETPDDKDVQELQARIQAEQVMQQNEATKLNMVAQLQQAQRDIQTTQALDRQMKSLKRNGTGAW
jgi:type IV secretion system protein VirB5